MVAFAGGRNDQLGARDFQGGTMNVRRLLGATASILLIALALTLVPVSGVAGAGTGPTLSASAFWQLHDARHTAVSLQPSRAPGEAPVIFVHITQEFCDSRTNHEIFRGFDAQAPLIALFRMDRDLHSASLAAIVTGHVVDQRLSNCSTPSGQPTTVDLGKVNVGLLAQWIGIGPIHTVQPGIDARSARAFGFFSGPDLLRIGLLGSTGAAELRRSTL